MAISYPLSLPGAPAPAGVSFRARSSVGMSESPFTYSQQVFEHQGEAWAAEVVLPPMKRAEAETWIAFFLSLNGRRGTFVMGDPRNLTPRGTWSTDSPLLDGAHAIGLKTLAVKGLTAGATWLCGDWLQLGSGSSRRLHKIVQDGLADGSGEGPLEIWPRLRETYADEAPLVLSSPCGIWRLDSNVSEWVLEPAELYAGLRFSCMEAL